MPTAWAYKGRGHSLFSVCARGSFFAVFDRGGVQIGPAFRSRADAARHRDELQAEADRRAKRGPRPCLCCGEVFASEGFHNRLCNRCRGAA